MKRQRAVGRPGGEGQQPKAPPMPAEPVSASIGPAGVVVVTIDIVSYPMVGQHWREQLTGKNARKWGRIYIDPDKAECKRRRDDALAPFRGLYKGEVGNNCDECPGAMFYWDGPEYPAHVQPLCAYNNQRLGRDLDRVLRNTIPGDTGWWEIVFRFR
jgi:hypothetical protein